MSICGVSGRIARLLLTKGQASDCVQGINLVSGFRPRAILGDKAYDTAQMLSVAKALGAELVVPSKKNRKAPRSLYKVVYRRRNIVERIFCRLKDYRRVATRYDKTDFNFAGFVFIAAILFNLKPTVNTA